MLRPVAAARARSNGENPPAAKARSDLPCDNPELWPVAKRVVDFYQATVKPGHNRKGGEQSGIRC